MGCGKQGFRQSLGLVAWMVGCIGTPHAATLDVSAFQYADGAITVQRKDAKPAPVVDPYFAAKALLAAMDLGLDISAPAHAWIGWMLPHQRPDGRFDRWCVSGHSYTRCAHADADDAALAVWIELIARLYADRPVPATWQVSLNTAEQYLRSLKNSAGYYHVSHALRVGLLMDNAEVYSALVALARQAQATGKTGEAEQKTRQAAQLAQATRATFWMATAGRYRPSTQRHKSGSFYPEAAAQLFPLLADMPLPDTRIVDWPAWFDQWRARHHAAWLAHAQHDYPWGLVALAAWKVGDAHTAACWLTRAGAQRDTARWNVLEEAIFQGLSVKLGRSVCS